MTFYYVRATGGSDSNPGTTTASAFATLSQAGQVMVAGDTTLVLSGNYNAGIYFTNGGAYDNGTTALPITMRSITPRAAKLKALGAPPTGGGNDAMWELRCNGWIIDGFELDASGGYSNLSAGGTWTLGGAGQYREGIFLAGLNQVAQNNYVHHLCLADPGGQGGAGIQSEGFYTSYASSNNRILYNHIHNTASNVTTNKSHGIYITAANTHVRGNLVYNVFGGVLLHGWHGFDGGSYVNNTVFNSTNVGLLIGQGDGGVAGGVSDFKGFNNIIVNCNIAIAEQGCISTGCVWSTNLIWACPTQYQLNAKSTAVARISASPGFVNYIQTGGGDYHLSTGSICINAGLASLSGAIAPTLDIDGNLRPSSATWDLGAYEFGSGMPGSSSITASATATGSTSTPPISGSLDTSALNFFGGHERIFIFHH